MSKHFSDLGINEQLLSSLVDLNISIPADINKKTMLVGGKKLFKTKPIREVSEYFKPKLKTIFHL